MNRKDFLRGLGVAGVGSMIPFKSVLADPGTPLTVCSLIPSETAGPFPLDLTENTTFFRSDIREDRTGTKLNLKIRVYGVGNCGVMENVRVNIWHCDKGGSYSGYSSSAGNTTDETGKTFLRGYQMTDSNGEVNFTTIFPGWYTGRICHIHFQIRVSSSYAAVSQMTFDVATKNAIYAANSSVYTKGSDPMSLSSDNIFSDGYSLQMCTLTANSDGSYDGLMEVAVSGNGTGIGHQEILNARNYNLSNVYPNPVTNKTTLPITIIKSSEVKCLIFDINGKEMGQFDYGRLSVGDHELKMDLSSMKLPAGNYAYVVQVRNDDGKFGETRVLTKVD